MYVGGDWIVLAHFMFFCKRDASYFLTMMQHDAASRKDTYVHNTTHEGSSLANQMSRKLEVFDWKLVVFMSMLQLVEY